MRFFEAPDGHGEPTIWVEYDGREHGPVLQRCQIHHVIRHIWPHIVRALTAGPTMESARVVVETLRDENTRLLEQVRALTAANEDLNAELISLRRSLLDERDREGCE